MKVKKWTKMKTITILVAGVLGATMLASEFAYAQVSTVTIKGQITVSGAPAKAFTPVTATNKETGYTYKTTTSADGKYVLTGLAPGSYEIRVSGAEKTETITVHVGETASLDLAVSGLEATDKIVIVGSAQRLDVKTSEVVTRVSREQIENLPQVTRNFMSFADLAPGVRFNVDPATGYTRLQSGAQSSDRVNIFIDGVSQKNYVLPGGVVGQDSSRGNPFPQSAVAEYKVISQNYKAEFDQVSSVAITAITKSGTNELHGDVFVDYTDDRLTEKNPFEKRAEANGTPRPEFRQYQYGASLGGPIIKDRIHYFASYEGKDNKDPRQITLQNVGGVANAGIMPALSALQGADTPQFKEGLVFGKLNVQLAEDQRLEVSAKVRREDDIVPESLTLSSTTNTKTRANNETRLDVKHEWSSDRWLNEARIGYEHSYWNPHPSSNAPFIKYKRNQPGNADIIWDGGTSDSQDKGQKGTLLQDDLTYTGIQSHTIKGGGKFKRVTLDMSRTANSVPEFWVLVNNDGTALPPALQTAAGVPFAVDYKNDQFGTYIQDDWQVNNQLELNLGVRWDYESNMLNQDSVTPADRVAALTGLDGRTIAGITAPPGQTYAQSLAKGGINITDYISTGSSRKAFKGAIQPRVGFSYDLQGDKASVVFGGWGRAYDRTMSNNAFDEKQKNAQPGGEIWLIKNDIKMPYTDQWTLGLRQKVAEWNTEIAYTNSQSHNGFAWFGGNRDPNGGFGNQSPIDPLWGGPQGFGTLILGDGVIETKTQTVFLKADKSYSKISGWGASFAYTYSDATTNHRDWNDDIFSWTWGRASGSTQHTTTNVERHRIIATGLVDLPWGFLLSGKLTAGSGRPYRIVSCAAGWNACEAVAGQGDRLRQVDVGIAKEFRMPQQTKLALRADVINLFNTVNYGAFDSWGGGPGNPQNYLGGDNPNLGTPTGMAGPMRTIKLGLRYVF